VRLFCTCTENLLCTHVVGFHGYHSFPIGDVLFTVEFRCKKPSRAAIFIKRIFPYLKNPTQRTKEFLKLFPRSEQKSATIEADKYANRDVVLLLNGGIARIKTRSVGFRQAEERKQLVGYRAIAQRQLNLFVVYLWYELSYLSVRIRVPFPFWKNKEKHVESEEKNQNLGTEVEMLPSEIERAPHKSRESGSAFEGAELIIFFPEHAIRIVTFFSCTKRGIVRHFSPSLSFFLDSKLSSLR